MNYGELKTRVAGHLHRTDLAGEIPTWILTAESRINRDVRALDMITTASLTHPSNPAPLPLDWLAMVSVTRTSSAGTPLKLAPISLDSIGGFRNDTDRPSVYAISGRNLYVAPSTGGVDVNMTYYQALPALAADADTNAILTAWPALYLYGALAEAFAWLRNTEERERAMVQFYEAVNSINAQATSSQMPPGARMRGI